MNSKNNSKPQQILELATRKVIREGWFKLSLRSLDRLLHRQSLRYDIYFPTKTSLGFALAEILYQQINSMLNDVLNECDEAEVVAQTFTANFSLWLQDNHRLLEILFDPEIRDEYVEITHTFKDKLLLNVKNSIIMPLVDFDERRADIALELWYAIHFLAIPLNSNFNKIKKIDIYRKIITCALPSIA